MVHKCNSKLLVACILLISQLIQAQTNILELSWCAPSNACYVVVSKTSLNDANWTFCKTVPLTCTNTLVCCNSTQQFYNIYIALQCTNRWYNVSSIYQVTNNLNIPTNH